MRTRVWACAAAVGAACLAGIAHGAEPGRSTEMVSATLLADPDAHANIDPAPQTRFTVNIGGQIMFRHIFNRAGHRPDDDDTTSGFQARRTKINIRGNIIDEDWDYAILTAFSRATGAPTIENAYIRRRIDRWTITAGQFKLPFLREELVSSTRLLAAERSTVHALFTQEFSQGIEIAVGGTDGDAFRLAGAFSDGLRSRNTDLGAAPADYALTARGELRLAGQWRQFREFTSFRGRPLAALLGTAVHWESGGDTTGSIDRNIASATADVSIVGDGWNLFGGGVWRRIDMPGSRFDDFGLVAQGGVFVSGNTELFGRWDAILADGDRPVGDFHTLTVGMNHYITPESHAAKLTVDVQYLFDAPAESLTPSASAGRGMGLMFDDVDSGQWAIRTQMQILF